MELSPIGVYNINVQQAAQAGGAPKTLLQVNAPATGIVVVFEAWIENAESETSTMEEYDWNRVSTAGTGTSVTPAPLGAWAAFGGTATHNHTAEGTAGTTVWRGAFNIVNGMQKLFIPGGQIIIPPSGRLALRSVELFEVAFDVNINMGIAVFG